MALDKVHPTLMTSMEAASETAPSSPNVGQRWYRASTGVTYQYTNDGTSSFWLDVSTGGLGRSTGRTIDYVGDTDPTPAHNGGSATLRVGHIYYNREGHRYFVCTDASNDANVWDGRYSGSGGLHTSYTSGSTHYRVHTFIGSGTFYVDSNITADILIVGGGGTGGNGATTGGSNSERGGGGGAGGMLVRTADTLDIGTYNVVVGDGGFHTAMPTGQSDWGENSSLIKNDDSIKYVAMGGGKGAHQGSHANKLPVAYNAASQDAGASGTDQYQGGAGGSGGGAHGNSGGNGGQAATVVNGIKVYGGSLANLVPTSSTTADQEGYYGSAGASATGGSYEGGGGGGAGAAGSSGSGGTGQNNSFRTGSNVSYANGADYSPSSGWPGDADPNTGNATRGGFESNGPGIIAGSGIVVIRYALN